MCAYPRRYLAQVVRESLECREDRRRQLASSVWSSAPRRLVGLPPNRLRLWARRRADAFGELGDRCHEDGTIGTHSRRLTLPQPAHRCLPERRRPYTRQCRSWLDCGIASAERQGARLDCRAFCLSQIWQYNWKVSLVLVPWLEFNPTALHGRGKGMTARGTLLSEVDSLSQKVTAPIV